MELWSAIHQWKLSLVLESVVSVIRDWKNDTLLRMAQWNRSKASTQSAGVHTRVVEDYRAGYPRLCALMEAHNGFFICRRFIRLRARLLLLKQDRISCLEEQLDKADEDDTLPFFLGKSRGDPNAERLSILSQLDDSLADYDSFLERARRILDSNPVASRDRVSLTNWLLGNGCISRLETAYLDQEKDLLNLAGPGDRATSQVENWVEDMLIEFCPGFRLMSSHVISTNSNVYIYSGNLIKRTAGVLLLLLISTLLLLPVIICTTTTSMIARMFIIIFSTAVYLALLSALTRARTFELILAGATFTTILVVFVSSTGDSSNSSLANLSVLPLGTTTLSGPTLPAGSRVSRPEKKKERHT
ncbi:uncharacterized protein F4807DRAFT_119498 [Annulohypoxylon truncatum]|uniref:uncharacterized protein n=1 Tax=Annulohypoxylon truncatum TaxID=327061 RepID=UPI00200759D4|nr:uncharacterized protein F4807DRAFT_119498 [Annulohypoxylon truncatum]KAI1214270.1 hypothetical protein F4807DRAFT_119498 [Annulohypoxylon truncatum]